MVSDCVTLTHACTTGGSVRRAGHPEPLEQPRQGLRAAIGNTLIHLGERLVNVVDPLPVDDAA